MAMRDTPKKVGWGHPDLPGPPLRPMGKGRKIFGDQLTSVLRAVSLAPHYENFTF